MPRRRKVKKVHYGRIFFILFLMIAGVYICITQFDYNTKDVFKDKEVVDNEQKENENIIDKENNENEEQQLQDTEGLIVNPLTGLYVEEDKAKNRPVAIMINNHKKAIPQSGISKADIIYEVPAEAELVRLMGVFSDLSELNKIGPVRSARHYFIDNALDNDAIYIHFGQSTYAIDTLKKLKIENLNAMAGCNNAPGKYLDHYRDSERKKTRGLEHSAYTTNDKIEKSWDKSRFRKERKSDFIQLLNFSDEELIFDGSKAEVVTIPYSWYQKSVFKYDIENKVYNRFQFDKPHIDAENNEQLKVKNIIIQYTDIHTIPKDPYLCREVKTIGSGKAIYVTNGTMKEIKWEKKDHFTPTKYMNLDGSELKVNKGKTWISFFYDNKVSEVSFNN